MRAAANQSPEDVSQNLADAISTGDLARAVSCFSHRARLMTPGETTLEGRDAVGELLAQLIGMKVRIRIQPHRLTYLDDRALLSERWHFRHTEVDGHGPFEQTTPALSLHSRIDGEGWKIVFLAPWGFS